jgi:hypothetical protein
MADAVEGIVKGFEVMVREMVRPQISDQPGQTDDSQRALEKASMIHEVFDEEGIPECQEVSLQCEKLVAETTDGREEIR